MGGRGREPLLLLCSCSAPAVLWISRRHAARWRDTSGDLGGENRPFFILVNKFE